MSEAGIRLIVHTFGLCLCTSTPWFCHIPGRCAVAVLVGSACDFMTGFTLLVSNTRAEQPLVGHVLVASLTKLRATVGTFSYLEYIRGIYTQKTAPAFVHAEIGRKRGRLLTDVRVWDNPGHDSGKVAVQVGVGHRQVLDGQIQQLMWGDIVRGPDRRGCDFAAEPRAVFSLVRELVHEGEGL